jgi:TfoX/Sxy family transcriptional regulator of competence genes
MAYDEELAELVREQVLGEPGLSEKRMFGGLAFLINGHMAVAASSTGGLLLRVDPEQTDDLLADPAAGPFVMRGRELDGWLRVELDASVSEQELGRWVSLGVTYARTLPAKT